jgi:hypothetical protein
VPERAKKKRYILGYEGFGIFGVFFPIFEAEK